MQFSKFHLYDRVFFILVANDTFYRRYSIFYPKQTDYKNARKLRCSPLYSILEKKGAIFETRMSYERPLYFDTDKPGIYF